MCATLLLIAFARSGAAQAPEPADTGGGVPVLTAVWRALGDDRRAGWIRPLSSAIIPGTGQMLARHNRGALYLIAEALLLTRFIAFNNEGRRERDRYQNLAFIVARGPFTPTRQDTAFDYFEQVGKFIESGPFDSDVGGGLVPPTDERTFNGSVWALARRTFFPDVDNPPPPDSPEYQRALAFYARRAVGPNFRWSWRNAGLEQDLFRQTIRKSDEAFRRATQQLGLLLANHVLSAVDAFITHRLSRPNRPIEVQSIVLPRDDRSSATRMRVAVTVWF